MFAKLRSDDTSDYLAHVKIPTILDLGNGRLRPQFTILKQAGHCVYGIDLANQPTNSIKSSLYVVARYLYNSKLSLHDATGKGGLLSGDVARLPLKREKFDLITSIAAFEHFLDVPAVISEMERVLKPRGVVWVLIHLFSCPSGGHNVTFTQFPLKKIPHSIDPWDHLRKRKIPFTVPLNEWRRDQYLRAFAEKFEILKHYCAFREGAELLSSEILAELSSYTADELTSNSYVILARKSH